MLSAVLNPKPRASTALLGASRDAVHAAAIAASLAIVFMLRGFVVGRLGCKSASRRFDKNIVILLNGSRLVDRRLVACRLFSIKL
jgi:hypothetical protein